MIIMHVNNNHRKDREYIYDVVFKYFWDIEYQLVYEKRDNLAIEIAGHYFYMDDSFFQMDERIWLKEESLPRQPLQKIELSDEIRDAAVEASLPIIYGRQGINSIFSEDGKTCFLDVFGSAFFMLTRYEEVVKNDRDEYDRFPAKASLAYQEGFLERPIINEYLEILWCWLRKHNINLKRKQRKFTIMPTHDVDVPFLSLSLTYKGKLRVLAGDLLKRHSLSLFLERLGLFLNAFCGRYDKDPRNSFAYIMDLSEKNGLVSNFYFMTSRYRSALDGNYNIFDKPIVDLVKNILERGHSIGIHPGFGSYNNDKWLTKDVQLFYEMLNQENFQVLKFGGRQHYLSWQAPSTWEYYEKEAIYYDTTLSYADHIGFRCGICYEYPVYNVLIHECYILKEYPLIIMDCTLWNERYMALCKEDMLSRCINLKKMCKKYNGNFVLLWHNTTFMDSFRKKLYEDIILG